MPVEVNAVDLNDSQLREELLKYGVDAAVVGSTRKFYERKLERLMGSGEPQFEGESEEEDEEEEEEEEDEPIEEPEPVKTSARKRQTITSTTRTTDSVSEQTTAKTVYTSSTPASANGATKLEAKSGMSLWKKLLMLAVLGGIVYMVIMMLNSEDNPIPKLQ